MTLKGYPCLNAIIYFSFLILLGCSENEEIKPLKATIATLEVDVPSVGGAIFSGELSGHELVEEHGFICSEDSSFTSYKTLYLSKGIPQRSGLYEYELATGLEQDKVYFFKAFMASRGKIEYGVTKSFLSNGSLPPKIESVYPDKGYIGSTVTIKGENLNWGNSYYTRVFLGEVEVNPVVKSDTIITFIVPDYIKTNEFPIKVTVFDKETEGVPFTLYAPEIHEIEPASATYRDIVTLKGLHFDTIPERNLLLLGNEKAVVLSSTRTEIKFVVPDEFRSDKGLITLQSQVQEITSSDYFFLKQPVIESFASCTEALAEFELIGENFHPNPQQNHVYFEGTEAEVLSGDTKKLVVTVPYGPFPDAKTKVSVRIAETSVVNNNEICIQDPWVMVTDQLPFTYYGNIGSFTAEDRAYVFSDEKLWIYNPDDTKWKGEEIPFSITYGIGSSTYNGQKAYVYSSDYNDNFWEYNPANSQWVKKADFPGHIRSGAAMFSIGNNVFLGVGQYSSGLSQSPLHDFYKYDPAKNQWVEIQSLVTDQYTGRIRMSSFVIGDNAYLAGGALNSGHYSAWKFNGVTEEWERIADMPEVVSYTASFVYKGKGYITSAGGWGVLGNECFQYDPTTNKWELFYPVGPVGRYNGFAFTLRGIPYVGGGYQSFTDVNVGSQMLQLFD